MMIFDIADQVIKITYTQSHELLQRFKKIKDQISLQIIGILTYYTEGNHFHQT